MLKHNKNFINFKQRQPYIYQLESLVLGNTPKWVQI